MIAKTIKTLATLVALSMPCYSFADFYVGGTLGSTGWDDGNDAVSYEILGGFQFNRFLAAEIAYNDLGSFDATILGNKYTTDIAGANYSFVALLPLADGINLKAKVSYFDFELERSINDRSIFTTQENAVTYGVGLDVNTWDNLYFTLEYRFIPIEYDEFGEHYEEEADNFSVGLKFAF